ncbi:MAG: NTP transferase domain-containing protein [Bacteroidaceae bacterium]|nr:NTP transferase domain-containing protein [Bacteroidaceae bacterium]
MKCMVFAAGLGTRLKPLTDQIPKALVPVAGRPLLQILLEKLHSAGFHDVVINVHHFASMIEEFVSTLHLDGMQVRFSDERDELLETGGGIKHAVSLLQGVDRFLIHNVDILSNVDLNAFFRRGEGTQATLLVSPRETQRYLLFDDEMRLVGWTNVKTGQVKSPYPNLDPMRFHKYAFAGIHQMSTDLFHYFNEWPQKFSIMDFYLSICHLEPIYGYLKPDLRLMDVGKLDTLHQAEFFLDSISSHP